MNFKTTKDILDHIRHFHHQISNYYHLLENETEQNKVKTILNYIGRHEQHFEEALSQFEETASKRILNTWFKFLPDENEIKDCEKLEIYHNMSVDDVIKVALRIDSCLINFYQWMVDHCRNEDIRDLFCHLLKMEKDKDKLLIRFVNDQY